MKKKPSMDMTEGRIVKRYHRLYVPLVELIQSLQDLVPDGMELGQVELTQMDGFVRIAYHAKPIQLVINDGERRFLLRIEEAPKKANQEQ